MKRVLGEGVERDEGAEGVERDEGAEASAKRVGALGMLTLSCGCVTQGRGPAILGLQAQGTRDETDAARGCCQAPAAAPAAVACAACAIRR